MLASLDMAIIIGNCLGWVEELASVHCFKLLNEP